MKKTKIILLLSLCLIALFTVFTSAYANNLPEKKPNQEQTIFFPQQINEDQNKEEQVVFFNLPASLTTIEESAFEGTSLITVEFPKNLETIKDNAFANIPTLKQIIIPNSTTFIDKDAFKGSNKVIITATPKSYARAYAQDNKIPFNPITSYYAFTPSPQITSISNGWAELQKLLVEGEKTDNQKANQTGRMTGDLNADRYDNFMAFHIQGRSPPMD